MSPIYSISRLSDLQAALPDVVQFGVLGQYLSSQSMLVNGVLAYLPPMFMLYANLSLTYEVNIYTCI